MMKRVRKPAPESGTSFKPQHSRFASRPFAPKAVEPEAPVGESRVSFSLADIDIFPRETVQPKLQLGPAGDRYEQEQVKPVPNRTGMPDRLKAGIESLSGIDMSDVRVHANSPKPARLNALAYTQGNQIYIGPGQERHLPHEAWHAVQQKLGRVRATRQMNATLPLNDEEDLEHQADAMGKRASASGQDVIFHQREFDPGWLGRQELVSHESAYIVRQNFEGLQISPLSQPRLPQQPHMGAPHTLMTARPNPEKISKFCDNANRFPLKKSLKGVIQRNVGFEFEVGNYPVTKMKRSMDPNEESGTTPIPNSNLDCKQLHKSDVMAIGAGFELQIDESDRDMHLEFVTSGMGFAEDKAGREALKTAMEAMEVLGQEIYAKTSASNIKTDSIEFPQVIKTGIIAGGINTIPETLIGGAGEMDAEPQTTAGIRFDRILTLIDNMVSPPGKVPNKARMKQRSVMAGKSNTTDINALKSSPENVERSIADFKRSHHVLPRNFGSNKLVGLMTLICVYLKKGQTTVNDYPKSLFPMLAITDFSTMFQMLPNYEKDYFTANPAEFATINLDAAGLHAGPFFSGGFGPNLTGMTVAESLSTATALGAITRQAWLSGIPAGFDLLKSGYLPNTGALLSMGRLNRGEEVGKTHLFRNRVIAPILEMRRHAGNLNIKNWKDWALDMYDFIVKLNDLKTSRFKSKHYDLFKPK